MIVAGFLPIYALTGPSAKLFRPMADTTIYALARIARAHADGHSGALLDRTARRSEGTTQSRVRVDSRPVCVGARLVSEPPRSRRSSASLVLFAVSLGIAFTRGGEFMPKLDEGALWVRATMPYTISFEESSKIVPQVRAILQSFPEVTVVASEHGRDDAGTDPTGFFNAEFYVGLKPYGEWNGAFHSKDRADRSDPEEARRLPRHHVQLHAAGRRRGRRSAHRPQGVARREGLRHRPRAARAEGARDQGRDREDSRHQSRDAGPGARPAEPHDHRRPRQSWRATA